MARILPQFATSGKGGCAWRGAHPATAPCDDTTDTTESTESRFGRLRDAKRMEAVSVESAGRRFGRKDRAPLSPLCVLPRESGRRSDYGAFSFA